MPSFNSRLLRIVLLSYVNETLCQRESYQICWFEYLKLFISLYEYNTPIQIETEIYFPVPNELKDRKIRWFSLSTFAVDEVMFW